ncbi:MAG: tryptophan 7-halogenase, partial [Lysobacter sp.]|nr:tryptophan 7-halogenase [Lysobacter sp.]
MTSFDVAIVGAGAAGSAAACALSPAVSVALLDRAIVPCWRIGETLPGAARRLLAGMGCWDRFAAAGHAPAPLKVSRWGSNTAVELDAMRDPDGAGWRLDRARFEADLRADAAARGAAFVGAGVNGLIRTGEGWQLSLDNGELIAARRLIDASGRRSRLLRGFGQRRLVMDRLACAYQRVPQSGWPDPTTYT